MIRFLASNLQFGDYPAVLQILGLSNAATKSQGLCCLLLSSLVHDSRYTASVRRAVTEQPCIYTPSWEAPTTSSEGTRKTFWPKHKGLNTRPDRESQANLLLTHTAGLSIRFCNEPTDMPYGHNLIKELQFRRVNGWFSMIATRALP